MEKKNTVFISRVMFPWETFGAAAEREAREIKNDGARWTPEFLTEVRQHVEKYAAIKGDETAFSGIGAQALRNECLHEIWRLTPYHYRNELFAGVYLPSWVTEVRL